MLAERDDGEAARLVRRAFARRRRRRAPAAGPGRRGRTSVSISRSSGIAPARSATASAAASALRSPPQRGAEIAGARRPPPPLGLSPAPPGPPQVLELHAGNRSSWSLRKGEWRARPGERVLNRFFTLCFIHTTAQISSVEDAQRLKPRRSQARSDACEYAESETRSHGPRFLKALRESGAADGACRRRERACARPSPWTARCARSRCSRNCCSGSTRRKRHPGESRDPARSRTETSVPGSRLSPG